MLTISYYNFKMSTTTQNHTVPSGLAQTTAFKVILPILLAILGLVLGCLGYAAWASGWLNGWRRLPTLPEPPVQISGATIATVDVETASGRIYRIDWKVDRPQWQEIVDPQSESDSGCEPFAAKAPPLSQVTERAVACRNYAEAGDTVVYALRDDGSIHYWYEASSAYEALFFMSLFPGCGAFLGLLAGLIFIIARRKRLQTR